MNARSRKKAAEQLQAAIDDIERRRQARMMARVLAIPANAGGKIKFSDIMDAVRKP